MQNLASTISNIVRAVAAALALFTWRWCAKTGTWVQERVVTPSIEYASQATTGAAQAVVGLVPDVIRSTARLPGQVIRGTGAAVHGAGKLTGATLGLAAAVPASIVSGLAAGREVAPPPAAVQKSGTAELRTALQALTSPTPVPPRPRSPERRIADLVHAYASADPYERDSMDLRTLPPFIAAWLSCLDEEDLGRLEAAGPDRCARHISGARPLVGIDTPEPIDVGYDPSAGHPGVTTGEMLADVSMLADRIARAKGVRRGTHPEH